MKFWDYPIVFLEQMCLSMWFSLEQYLRLLHYILTNWILFQELLVHWWGVYSPDGLNAYNEDAKFSHHIHSFKMMSSHSPFLDECNDLPAPKRLLRETGKFIGGSPMPKSTLAWQWACQSTQGGDGTPPNSAPDTVFRCTHSLFTQAGLDSETQGNC